MAISSSEAYSFAYKVHYNKKDYHEALRLYLTVMRDYPDSNEARYAVQQLENLKKQIDFSSINYDDPSINRVIEDYNAGTAEKEKNAAQQAAARTAYNEGVNAKIEKIRTLKKRLICFPSASRPKQAMKLKVSPDFFLFISRTVAIDTPLLQVYQCFDLLVFQTACAFICASICASKIPEKT